DDSLKNNIILWEENYNKEQLQYALEVSNCLEFISQLPDQLETQIGENGIKLSGGQKQRITIAREIYKNPEILIFDEATSALDSESEEKIQGALNQLKGKLTLIVIAHRFSTIQF